MKNLDKKVCYKKIHKHNFNDWYSKSQLLKTSWYKQLFGRKIIVVVKTIQQISRSKNSHINKL